MPFACKFSQLQYYQMLLKSVNIWPSTHKNKKVNFSETQCMHMYMDLCLATVFLRLCFLNFL